MAEPWVALTGVWLSGAAFAGLAVLVARRPCSDAATIQAYVRHRANGLDDALDLLDPDLEAARIVAALCTEFDKLADEIQFFRETGLLR